MVKRKSDSTTSTSQVAKRPKTLSPLELLPTELFVDILRCGTPASVLALKLTSSTILHKTKYSNGTEVVSIEAMLSFARDRETRIGNFFANHNKATNNDPEWRATAVKKAWDAYDADKETEKDYLAMRVRCEADTPQALLVRLTCSRCGLSKTHGIEGFGDCHFKPSRSDRKCLVCSVNMWGGTAMRMKVCGKKIFECFVCFFVKYKTFEAAKTVSEELVERTTQYAQGKGVKRLNRKACKSCTDDMVRLCSGPQSENWFEALCSIRSTVGEPK